MADYDFLVCGAGIAGASLAYELAEHGRVLIAEQEDRPGFHTTGRSAALYDASYGNAAIRALTGASRGFFDAPPDGFADYPLLTRRGCLYIARSDQLDLLAAMGAEVKASGGALAELEGAAARALAPVLRAEAVAAGLHDAASSDIDVNALHLGFLRAARARGAQLRVDARLTRLDPVGGGWRAKLAGGETVTTAVVVNAAGAWCDRIAALAGAAPVGLTPLRRTAILLDPPDDVDIAAWPAVIAVDEAFYFKPEAGKILASPGDETPSEPLDAAPDELDIAICVDRLQAAADIPVRRVLRSWAGLRTFAPDRTPVIGYDLQVPGFFWCAGQGGYGIQTSPAAARLGCALATGAGVPQDIAARGLAEAMVSPARFGRP